MAADGQGWKIKYLSLAICCQQNTKLKITLLYAAGQDAKGKGGHGQGLPFLREAAAKSGVADDEGNLKQDNTVVRIQTQTMYTEIYMARFGQENGNGTSTGCCK